MCFPNQIIYPLGMMVSSNGSIYCVTGLLCGGIHRSPVNSSHKGQWRGALMFSLICAWINGWVNNLEAGDLRRHRAHYDVIVMDINRTVGWMTKPNYGVISTQCILFIFAYVRMNKLQNLLKVIKQIFCTTEQHVFGRILNHICNIDMCT